MDIHVNSWILYCDCFIFEKNYDTFAGIIFKMDETNKTIMKH